MSVRLPLTGVLDVTNTDLGAASLIGGYAYPFKIPQDCDNVLVKMTASVTAGGFSAIFQTSDDGGSTYYDVARTSIVSANEVGKAPQWLSIPVIQGPITRSSVVAVGSVISVNSMGPVSASTLGTGQYSGLPVMGLQNRVFAVLQGGATANNSRIQVLVNSQSAAGQ